MRTINLSDIIISENFLKSNPNDKKIKKVIKYIKKHGKIDKPIVLNNGVLVDNYVRYLASKINGLQEVPYVELQQMNYIIGKFDNCDKEYIWKNDMGVNIKVGDNVVVCVKHGGSKNKKVYVNVVDIFSSDSLDLYNKHKSIVKIKENY